VREGIDVTVVLRVAGADSLPPAKVAEAGFAGNVVEPKAVSRLPSAIIYQASAQDPFVLAVVSFTGVLRATPSATGPAKPAQHIDPENRSANNRAALCCGGWRSSS
jgi:hypothetical protein